LEEGDHALPQGVFTLGRNRSLLLFHRLLQTGKVLSHLWGKGIVKHLLSLNPLQFSKIYINKLMPTIPSRGLRSKAVGFLIYPTTLFVGCEIGRNVRFSETLQHDNFPDVFHKERFIVNSTYDLCHLFESNG
jgi:hypothetical protein